MTNAEHSLTDFLKNENIKSDRFAYAAISYIFKAFGDNKRSEEFWPWGKNVNFSWNNGNDNIDESIIKDINDKSWNISGPKSNLTRALLCIAEAHNRGFDQNDYDNIIKESDSSIKEFRKRLANSIYCVKKSDKITDKINEISRNTINQIEELEIHE